MKMAGPVLSWPPGLIRNILSRAFSSATIASEPHAPSQRSIAMGFKLAKAKSAHWELFKYWMTKYNKRYASKEMMLNKYKIFVDNMNRVEKGKEQISRYMIGLNQFSDNLNYVQKMRKNSLYDLLSDIDSQYEVPEENSRKHNIHDFDTVKLAEAQCSAHWKVFKSWMSEYKKNYKSDGEMLYRFEVFVKHLKYVEEMNKRMCEYKLDTLNLNLLSDSNFSFAPQRCDCCQRWWKNRQKECIQRKNIEKALLINGRM